MSYFLVCPWDIKAGKKAGYVDKHLVGMFKRWQKSKKHPTTVVDLTKAYSLSGLGRYDTLLILGHGSYNSTDLYSRREKPKKKAQRITCNDLAQTIASAGLPKTHNYVVLLSCFGLGAMDEDVNDIPNYSTMGPKGEGFAAQVLAKCFGKLDYHSIEVTGYPGEVTYRGGSGSKFVSEAFATVDDYSHIRHSKKASEGAKTFNSQGNEVNRYHPFQF